MTLALDLSLRIIISGLMGALIGYERELRGKDAGIRTHLLVAIGSCLFMIVSQYGFPEAGKFDASRVASGVVGGLGFLGGGLIIKNKFITGLTTAAGIWVTGAVGLALGSGMYELSFLCVFIMLLTMETMHFSHINLGVRQVNIVISAKNLDDLQAALKQLNRKVMHFSWSKKGDRIEADATLSIKKKDYPLAFIEQIKQIPNVELESMGE